MKKRSERKAAAAGRRPPLDSQNWIPIKNAFSRVYQRTGNLQLAAKDLTELLAARRNRVRSMRRSLVQGQEPERELLSTKFWHENVPYALSDDLTHSLFVVPVEKFGSSLKPHQYPASHVYYVWQPDLDKLYPTARTDDKPQRRRPGPKIKQDWRLFVAVKVDEIREKKKSTPSAGELAQLCEDKIGYQPDESEIQKFLRTLLNE